MYKGYFYFQEKDKPLIQKYDVQQDKFSANMTVPYLNVTNPKTRLYTTKYNKTNYQYYTFEFD